MNGGNSIPPAPPPTDKPRISTTTQNPNMNAIASYMLILIAAAITYMAGWFVVSQYLLLALAIIAALQLLALLLPLLFAAALCIAGACASLYSKIVNRKS